jgi:hypothetical protein
VEATTAAKTRTEARTADKKHKTGSLTRREQVKRGGGHAHFAPCVPSRGAAPQARPRQSDDRPRRPLAAARLNQTEGIDAAKVRAHLKRHELRVISVRRRDPKR